MSKDPWTAFWAAIVVIVGLGVAYVTRPAQSPIPLPLPPGKNIEVAEQQQSQTKKPAAKKNQDELVDPILRLVDPCLALVDKHWNEWDADQSGTLSWTEFVAGLDRVLKLPVALANLLPDLSGDGIVTREEARGTIEFSAGSANAGEPAGAIARPGPTRRRSVASGMGVRQRTAALVQRTRAESDPFPTARPGSQRRARRA
jgi:hypothetical protein